MYDYGHSGGHNDYVAQAKARNKTSREKYGKNIAEYFGLEDTDLFPFIVTRKSVIGSKSEKDVENPVIANGYVRWDALCHLFNTHFIPKNEKDGKPTFVLSACQIINEDKPIDGNEIKAGKHVSPVLMAKVNNPLATVISAGDTTALDNSLDPTVCLFPSQVGNDFRDNPRSKQLYPSFAAHGILPSRGDEKHSEELIKMTNYPFSDNEQKYYIGHILLNIQRLQQTYKSMKYDEDGVEKEDFYMYNYIEKIWDNVNEACGGNHDFKITTDFERPNIVRVVDMRYQENINLKQEDIIELNIQSNDSIVRDFSFNTSIPSSLSSTIAIAAQAPKNADSLQAASFGAFHKNISNRFATFIEPKDPITPTEEEQNGLADNFDDEMKTYVTGLQELSQHMVAILGGEYLIVADGGDSVRSEEIGKYKGLVSAVKKASENLISMYPKDKGNHYKGQIIKSVVEQPTSAIIPLKFTATLDGISGIIIGNVFKLPDSRLPRGYKDANVGFVVMGEDQKITSGQDWTTNITGQMIILPKKGTGVGASDGWDGFDFNSYDESADTIKGGQYVDPTDEDQKITAVQADIDEGLNAVKEGDPIYLKMGKDDTHVRSSSDINHESEADWGDNVIGLFKKGNKGLYLGTVASMTNTKIMVMVRGRNDDPDTDANEATDDQYYRANKDGTPNKSKPMTGKISNDNWPWYKINFSKEAIDEFRVGWINDEDGDRDKDGADDQNAAIWTQKKQGWMRMDVLWSSAAAAPYNESEAVEEELARLEAYKLGNKNDNFLLDTPEYDGDYGMRIEADDGRWTEYFKFFQTDIFTVDSGGWELIDKVLKQEDYDPDFQLYNLKVQFCATTTTVGVERRITYLNTLSDLKR